MADESVDDVLGRFAGRELGFDEAVYRSESETGHRNRAIGIVTAAEATHAEAGPDVIAVS